MYVCITIIIVPVSASKTGDQGVGRDREDEGGGGGEEEEEEGGGTRVTIPRCHLANNFVASIFTSFSSLPFKFPLLLLLLSTFSYSSILLSFPHFPDHAS